LNLAKDGDAVTISGFYQPPDDTKVKADRITVSTERVYGEATEATPQRTRRTRRRGEASEKATDAAEAGDDTAKKENGAETVDE
jgi:hypothetical protein